MQNKVYFFFQKVITSLKPEQKFNIVWYLYYRSINAVNIFFISLFVFVEFLRWNQGMDE